MDLDRFMSQRQGAWRRLSTTLELADRSGLDMLTVDQLRQLGALYRGACSDLIYAKTVLQNDELGDYLNKLVGDAYATIYRRSWFSRKLLWHWFARDLPAAVRRNAVAVVLAWVFLLGGVGIGFGVSMADREAFQYFVPTHYQQAYGKRPDDVRRGRFGDMSLAQSQTMSAHLMANNIRVSFTAFVFGASFGVLTAISMFYNGLMLGSIASNFHRWGQDLDFWGLIVPHGGLEFSCIALAGAAGFVLAGALIRPGRRTRGEAFAAAGREAVPLALGAVPFLVIAGIIEAFVTPSSMIGPWAKLALGIVTGAALWFHLLLPRRAHA